MATLAASYPLPPVATFMRRLTKKGGSRRTLCTRPFQHFISLSVPSSWDALCCACPPTSLTAAHLHHPPSLPSFLLLTFCPPFNSSLGSGANIIEQSCWTSKGAFLYTEQYFCNMGQECLYGIRLWSAKSFTSCPTILCTASGKAKQVCTRQVRTECLSPSGDHFFYFSLQNLLLLEKFFIFFNIC